MARGRCPWETEARAVRTCVGRWRFIKRGQVNGFAESLSVEIEKMGQQG